VYLNIITIQGCKPNTQLLLLIFDKSLST